MKMRVIKGFQVGFLPSRELTDPTENHPLKRADKERICYVRRRKWQFFKQIIGRVITIINPGKLVDKSPK